MINNDIITIFTPTYNRAYVIGNLYNSLKNQTNHNFEWLVIDDGSNDNTEILIKSWILENKIKINYIKQQNGGKHTAHNNAVANANTEWFVCVDSDDELTVDAVETVNSYIKENKDVIGFVAKRGGPNGESITSWEKNIGKVNFRDAQINYDLKGDTMLVFKTSLLRSHLFPVIPEEKFMPEAYIYDQISKDGTMFFIDKVLYICKYLSDGYTYNMRKVNALNPIGYLHFIIQRIEDNTNAINVLDIARYYAITKCVKPKYKHKIKKLKCNCFFKFIGYYLGLLFFLKEYRKYVR